MIARDILSRFPAVLLDMNGTLMFGGDRFGTDQDYAATYRSLGGSQLSAAVIQAIVQTCYNTMGAIYDDPSRSDSFPRVLDTLRTLPAARGLPEAELQLLERVIAHQEVGRIPDAYAAWVSNAARSHVLGLIANLLSRKDLWVQEFKRAGVLDCFKVMVFSSDGSSMKPSRKVFDRAMEALGVSRSGAVFVGDNLRCDVGGARGAGLASVWIDSDRRGLKRGDPQPDFVVNDLRELLDS